MEMYKKSAKRYVRHYHVSCPFQVLLVFLAVLPPGTAMPVLWPLKKAHRLRLHLQLMSRLDKSDDAKLDREEFMVRLHALFPQFGVCVCGKRKPQFVCCHLWMTMIDLLMYLVPVMSSQYLVVSEILSQVPGLKGKKGQAKKQGG